MARLAEDQPRHASVRVIPPTPWDGFDEIAAEPNQQTCSEEDEYASKLQEEGQHVMAIFEDFVQSNLAKLSAK
jgi:hypothetical protein